MHINSLLGMYHFVLLTFPLIPSGLRHFDDGVQRFQRRPVASRLLWVLISIARRPRQHAAEDVDEVVHPPQVAVLPVALHPGRPVVQRHGGRQGNRLAEVDHPDAGFSGCVVHEQKRAAHDLRQRERGGGWGVAEGDEKTQRADRKGKRAQGGKRVLTSWVLKKSDFSRTERSSSRRFR